MHEFLREHGFILAALLFQFITMMYVVKIAFFINNIAINCESIRSQFIDARQRLHEIPQHLTDAGEKLNHIHSRLITTIEMLDSIREYLNRD